MDTESLEALKGRVATLEARKSYLLAGITCVLLGAILGFSMTVAYLKSGQANLSLNWLVIGEDGTETTQIGGGGISLANRQSYMSVDGESLKATSLDKDGASLRLGIFEAQPVVAIHDGNEIRAVLGPIDLIRSVDNVEISEKRSAASLVFFGNDGKALLKLPQ